MWHLSEINIKGLMTHLDTKYVFKKGKCLMLYGQNLTDEGFDSNGSGKSTLLEGITLAFTGDVFRNVKKDQYINDSCDETLVDLSLYNNNSKISTLRIVRKIHRKKSAKVEIWENGELNKEITSVNEANRRVFELIGISKDDLLRFFIIPQKSNYSFFTAGDTEKKNIISRFINTDSLKAKVEELKELSKAQSSTKRKFENAIENEESKIEIIQGEINEEKANAESRIAKRIKIQKDKIKIKESENFELKSEIEDYEEKLNLLPKIQNLDSLTSEIAKRNKKRANLRAKKDEILSQAEEASHTLKHLNLIKKGGISCPSCSHKFNPNEDIDLKEIPEMVEALKIHMLDLDDQKSNLETKFRKNKESLSKLIEEESHHDKIENQKKKYKRAIKGCNEDIKFNEKSIKSCNKNIDTLNKEVDDDSKLKDWMEKLKISKNYKKNLIEDLQSVEKEIEENEFWIHHFGKKGFMTFLVNKSIKSIEGMTNSFLKKINTDIQILIEGFTVLKSGDLNEKIDVSVVRNGQVLGTFERYSGGETGRIDLMNILAMQKLFNLTAPNGGLSFLGLDERFEGLDITGQKDLIKILENLNITTLVVSHRSTSIGSDNELFAIKRKGVTEISKRPIEID